jgi:undecaprenyl-diphosphatase
VLIAAALAVYAGIAAERGSRAQALILLVPAGGIQLLVTTGKEGYVRPRPDVGSAIELPSSFSFPSGHAATRIAIFGLLGLLASTYARTALPATRWSQDFALDATIGASRLVLNVH